MGLTASPILPILYLPSLCCRCVSAPPAEIPGPFSAHLLAASLSPISFHRHNAQVSIKKSYNHHSIFSTGVVHKFHNHGWGLAFPNDYSISYYILKSINLKGHLLKKCPHQILLHLRVVAMWWWSMVNHIRKIAITTSSWWSCDWLLVIVCEARSTPSGELP